jgi:uncharacterized protein (TIGR00255 family)
MNAKSPSYPVRSMTGFARVSCGSHGIELDLEARSVNHRFFDVAIKGPRRYAIAERDIKAVLQKLHRRGRVEISLSRRVVREEVEAVEVLPSSLDRYVQMYGAACRRYGVSSENLGSFIGQVLLREDESRDEGAPSDEEMAVVLRAVEELSEALAVMRESEGAALVQDLSKRLALLGNARASIAQLAAAGPARLQERLRERLKALAPEIAVDPERLATEVAFLADRIDVAEELSRLAIHLDKFQHTLAGEADGVGRKLDFLTQEIGRELNTVGSKAQDAQIQGLVVEAKAELERIREQVQNIE